MYAVIKISSLEIVRSYNTMPSRFEVPSSILFWTRWKRIKSPATLGDEYGGYRLVELVDVNAQRPGQFYHDGGYVLDLGPTTLTRTRVWTPWTQQEIDDYNDANADEETQDIVTSRLGRVVFRLAKEHYPNMTPEQFLDYVRGS